MSFLALRSRAFKPWQLNHQVDTTSTAPGTGLQQQQGGKPRKSKELHRQPKGGKDVDFHGVGVDSSWNGRRARASMELCKEGKSVHGLHAYTLAFAAFWVGIRAYGFLAPSQNSAQTAADKATFFKLLIPPSPATSGLDAHAHHLAVAAHLDALFTILALWPALHAATTTRQRAALQAWGYEGPVLQLSAWPLVGASFAFGTFALLPLLSSWRMPALVAPSPPLLSQPPRQQQQQLQHHNPHHHRTLETQGTSTPRARSADFSLSTEKRQSGRAQSADYRGTRRSATGSGYWPSRQSRLGAPEVFRSPQERLPSVPPVLVAGAASCIHQALTSRGNAWATYRKLLDECRLSHSAAVEFIHLTAQHSRRVAHEGMRSWDRSETWLPVLSALPAICPTTLLLLLPSHHPNHPCKLTSPSQLRRPLRMSSTDRYSSSSCTMLFGGGGNTATSPSSSRGDGRRCSSGGSKSCGHQGQGRRSASMELGRRGHSSSPSTKGQQQRPISGSNSSPPVKGPQRVSMEGTRDPSSTGGSGQEGGSTGGALLPISGSNGSPSMEGPQRVSMEGTRGSSSTGGSEQEGGGTCGTSLPISGSSDSPSVKDPQGVSMEGTRGSSSTGGSEQEGGGTGGTSLWNGAKMLAYNLVAPAR